MPLEGIGPRGAAEFDASDCFAICLHLSAGRSRDSIGEILFALKSFSGPGDASLGIGGADLVSTAHRGTSGVWPDDQRVSLRRHKTPERGEGVGGGVFSCAKDGSDHWNAQRDRRLNP